MSSDWIQELRNVIKGDVLEPKDPGYAEAARTPYKDHPKNPAVIVLVKNAADVIESLKVAHSHKKKVSIKSGGHGWLNFSLENELVINLSKYVKEIDIRNEEGVALVEAGALLGQVYEKAYPYGKVVTGGWCPWVAAGGLMPGGGGSLIDRKHGLACDSVTSIEIATWSPEDKQFKLLTANHTEHYDLFKAFRGGGSNNFGVAIRYTVKLHPIPPVVTAAYLSIAFERTSLIKLLAWYHKFTNNGKENLDITPLVLIRSRKDANLGNKHSVDFLLLYNGPPKFPENTNYNGILSYFLTDPDYKAQISLIETVPYHVALPRTAGELGAPIPGAGHQTFYMFYDNGFTNNTEPIVDIVLDYFARIDARNTERIELQVAGFGGKAVDNDEVPHTSISFRDHSFMIGLSVMDDEPIPDNVEKWARELMAELRAKKILAQNRAYVNFRVEGGEETLVKYYEQHLDHLSKVKRDYDPHGVFDYPQGLRPAAPQ